LETSGSEIIWRLLAWLLHARDELKERAYLAQFLVRVKIPTEVIWDEDVALLYQQYEDQIDSFKQVHMKLKKLKRQAEERSVSELVGDTKRIEHDFDCLSRKVETAKERVRTYLKDPLTFVTDACVLGHDVFQKKPHSFQKLNLFARRNKWA